MICLKSSLMMSGATFLAVFWIYLMLTSTKDDEISCSAAKIIIYQYKLSLLKQKLLEYKKKMQCFNNDALIYRLILLRTIKNIQKRIGRNEDFLKHHSNDIFANKNPLCFAGYSFVRFSKMDINSQLYAKVKSLVSEIYGKENALVLCKHMWAQAVSLFLLGSSAVLVLTVFITELGKKNQGGLLLLLGFLIILTCVYTIFDDLNYKVKKRRKKLLKDFPHMVSKLALLVNAGMDLNQSWKITAFSGYTPLYVEMQLVCKELDNGISLHAAYGNFVKRCNVNQITRLGVAIEQAYLKGNSEVTGLLKNLSREVWQERKHYAKRQAELANSKLLLPIMMIFIGIIILVLAPIVMNLSF